MKKGIVFSHEENTNELKVSRYDSDSLALILNVPLFNYDTSEFTEDAVNLAKELGFELTVTLIHTGSPMDAVQDVWLDKKLKDFAENSSFNLDELLKESEINTTDVKELSDEELKAELKERLCTGLSDSEFEALFVSQKVVNNAIKRANK